MKQKELVKLIHEDFKDLGISRKIKDSEEIVEIVFRNLSGEIVKGKTIKIIGFGEFRSDLRTVNNFGNKIKSWVIKFKPSRILRAKING